MAKYDDRGFYNASKAKRWNKIKLILIFVVIVLLFNLYSTTVHDVSIVEVIKNMLGR